MAPPGIKSRRPKGPPLNIKEMLIKLMQDSKVQGTDTPPGTIGVKRTREETDLHMTASPAKKTPLDLAPKADQRGPHPEPTQKDTQAVNMRQPRLSTTQKKTPIDQRTRKTPIPTRTPRRGATKSNRKQDEKQPSISNYLSRTRTYSNMKNKGTGLQSPSNNLELNVFQTVTNTCIKRESIGGSREENKTTHTTKGDYDQHIMPDLGGDKVNQQTSDRDLNLVK